jgi:hypothetical protein
MSMNGNGKLFWWTVGTLTTLLLGIGSGTLATVRQHAERIAVLESQADATRRQLDKIEHKLDRLLEVQAPPAGRPP